jgi:DNA-binding CsgD family transcriptional regulator
MADGKVLAEIAQEMGLTPFTVQSYKKTVRMRMRAATSEQAVAAALRRGLID